MTQRDIEPLPIAKLTAFLSPPRYEIHLFFNTRSHTYGLTRKKNYKIENLHNLFKIESWV